MPIDFTILIVPVGLPCLANIQGKLSRAEMKNIMAGSGGSGGYTCCWSGTTNCSACVPGGYPSCGTYFITL